MDEQATAPDPFWVFAYGSLMWKPGFDAAERVRARLSGYRRGFCMWSIHHRGTEASPGLVLALDPAPQEICEGIAFRVEAQASAEVHRYLRERELVSSAYMERIVELALEDGRKVEALAYVMNRDHEQYTGALSLARQAEVIAGASGGMGRNDDYLFATLEHLEEMGCPDPQMAQIARLVRGRSSV